MDSTVRETLAFVNKKRREFGLPTLAELPAGRIGHAFSCPIARGLCGKSPTVIVEGDVGTETAHMSIRTNVLEKTDHYVNLPRAARRFVKKFDNGKYGQYEA